MIQVYWQNDNMWYDANVLDFDEASCTHLLHYTDDSTEEYVDLRFEMWQPAPQSGLTKGSEPTSKPKPIVVPRQHHERPHPPQQYLHSTGSPDEASYGAPVATSSGHGQVPTREQLTSLVKYVLNSGGSRDLLDGWTCLRYYRGVTSR